VPSIHSQLFSSFADRAMKSIFSDFNLDRARGLLASVDSLNPAPTGVSISSRDLSHCSAEWIRTGRHTDRVAIYLPGGAWVLRSPRTHRRIATGLAKAANCDVLLVFYRLAPEHPFPAGLEDCVEAYETLLGEGVDPSRIVIGGDSAGGNLTLAALLALRDGGAPTPAGAFALSPCTDMSLKEGGAQIDPDELDSLFSQSAEGVDSDPRLLYAAGNEEVLEHPYASPIRADLHDLCPLLLQVGSTESLVDQVRMFADRARAAGVDAEAEVWEGQPHVWHTMPLPEAEQAFEHLGDFVRRCCP
jgi:monoterpene epsilon-lactone hydrolase